MLSPLGRFRRKKEETKANIETPRRVTELEQLCGDDKQTYDALLDAMLLDPRKTGTTMKEAGETAKAFLKEKDPVKARVWYQIAGGLAIYEGNTKKVIEYFTECEKLSSNKTYSILKNPEKAVAVAQEYYKMHLKA